MTGSRIETNVSGSWSGAGVARFGVGPEVAEPAVVVADGWQRRGLGTLLLERLADRARAEGITRFSAIVLAPNRDAMRLLERFGDATAENDGGVLHFDIALADSGGGGFDAAWPVARGGCGIARSGRRVAAPRLARA